MKKTGKVSSMLEQDLHNHHHPLSGWFALAL